MPLIEGNVLQGPLQPLSLVLLTLCTVLFGANGAGQRWSAVIGMNKHFQRLWEVGANKPVQLINFLVCLANIKIPWQGQVAIQVQDLSVFDDPEIM